MTLIAGAPEPSRFTRVVNGDCDFLAGYDDGEPRREYRSETPGEPSVGGTFEADNAAANEEAGIGH